MASQFNKLERLTALILVIYCYTTMINAAGSGATKSESKQVWDYVKVRDDAFMFWWLYYTEAGPSYTTKPLVMWLQGGPGASSTGYGNFMEIGPADIHQNRRNTTWLTKASLLFVDNPVGTGYSYVTSDGAYTRNDADIARDLLTMLQAFMGKIKQFQKVPFYIFSESYGGKMTAAFSQVLYNAIKNGDIQCNFKGFAMGDSWISPVDSVMTWGPYLYSTSIVDEQGLSKINTAADVCRAAVQAGNWTQATGAWSELEDIVETTSNGVNFYNILKWGQDTSSKSTSQNFAKFGGHHDHVPRKFSSKLKSLYHRHVKVHSGDDLAGYMNGPVKDKLQIIPKNVTWGGQAGGVFQALSGDFMKNVIHTVDSMLNTEVKVVVYSGQLDLIVDTMGTEQWIQKLQWSHLSQYNSAARTPFYTGGPTTSNMAGFVKRYNNFSFYWILNAGHMVPADAGEAALLMLSDIIQS